MYTGIVITPLCEDYTRLSGPVGSALGTLVGIAHQWAEIYTVDYKLYSPAGILVYSGTAWHSPSYIRWADSPEVAYELYS